MLSGDHLNAMKAYLNWPHGVVDSDRDRKFSNIRMELLSRTEITAGVFR